MIVGVTGPICAGNNAVGEILRKKGFERLSLSDELREYMRKRGIVINRRNMRDTADALRKEHGPGFMVSFVVKKIIPDKNYVVEAIMNPREISELKKLNNFYLIKVDAPVKIRFNRLLRRNRDPDEPKTFEAFVEWEKRDLGVGQPKHGLHRAECFELADFIVVNDGTLNDLCNKIRDIIGKIKSD